MTEKTLAEMREDRRRYDIVSQYTPKQYKRLVKFGGLRPLRPAGWFGESQRHALAGMGVKTGTKKPVYIGIVHNGKLMKADAELTKKLAEAKSKIDREAKAKMIAVSLEPKDVTSSGNEIKRGFSMAGSYGTEFDVEERWLNKGFKELYNEAPYHWAVYNPKTLELFTYTEGDTALIKAKSKTGFLKEIKAYQEYAKNQEEYIKPYEKIESEVYG